MVSANNCLHCGKCRQACPNAQKACTSCGLCVRACPQGLRKICGKRYLAEDLAAKLLRDRDYLAAQGGGVTFSGGEPFCQAEALVPVAEAVKAMHKHLMIYTGYLYEQLLKMEESGVQRLLELADVLVDGPFLMAERNLTLQYRGSENQRVIDLAKTRAAGEIILYKSEYDEL